MNKKNIYRLKIGFFMFFLVVVDQVSKYLANTHLKGKNELVIINKVLNFYYLDGGNRGAAWGMFSGKIVMFIIFTIIAIFVISIFMKNIYGLIVETDRNLFRGLNVCMALLMSGAIGNLIDRVVHNYVIDFIYIKFIDFPIFNVADCYVTVSCALIIILCLFKVREEEFNQIVSLKSLKRSKR